MTRTVNIEIKIILPDSKNLTSESFIEASVINISFPIQYKIHFKEQQIQNIENINRLTVNVINTMCIQISYNSDNLYN